MKKWLFFLLTAPLWSASLRLQNDTSYDLKAVISGADGLDIQTLVIKSNRSQEWTDSGGHFCHFGKGTLARDQTTFEQSPYQVVWYCLSGDEFSRGDHFAPNSTVTASRCQGYKKCGDKTPKSLYPNQPTIYYRVPEKILDEETVFQPESDEK